MLVIWNLYFVIGYEMCISAYVYIQVTATGGFKIGILGYESFEIGILGYGSFEIGIFGILGPPLRHP